MGQEHIVRTLSNAIKLDRVHHAFLFTGARGVGKTTTARVLARALNCTQGPTVDPCGQCVPCREIEAGVCADVLEIDGASNTGVDNVREIRETVRYLPSSGRYKLYIIDEVHMLSQAAFNALLKTLEEPPPHVKFIFATTEPHKIPVTILSRCQHFDFRRVAGATIADHLQNTLIREGLELSSTVLAAVARESQGSVRDALSLLEQVLSYTQGEPDDDSVLEALGIVDRQTVFDLWETILDREGGKLLDIIEKIDRSGHDLAQVASLLVEHLRDLTVTVTVDDPQQVLSHRSPGEIESLLRVGKKRSRADLHRLFPLMVAVAEDVGVPSSPARVWKWACFACWKWLLRSIWKRY